jgi:hypothetical protein
VTATEALLNLLEFAAIYWPRVKVLNPTKSVFGPAEQIVVPPSGIVAGVFARTDGATPGGVYDPPADIDKGRMFGVLGFETDEVLEEARRGLRRQAHRSGGPCHQQASRVHRAEHLSGHAGTRSRTRRDRRVT